MLRVLFIAWLTTSALVAEEIKNPFYKKAVWKNWRADSSPVKRGEEVFFPVMPGARIYPQNIGTNPYNKDFLHLRWMDYPGRTLAGFWDDVYVNFDNQHSFIKYNGWYGSDGKHVILKGQVMETTFKMSPNSEVVKRFGINFSSQSTTLMGHDQTDSFEEIDEIEKNYYFCNALRAGPAHISYRDMHPDKITDEYEVMVPSFYNSVGSSGSELYAIYKMIIAGGYLSKELKLKLKNNGLYIATLLYAFKAALPYNAPYLSPMRHRVAYPSVGEPVPPFYRRSKQLRFNLGYYSYDENKHLVEMCRLVMGLKSAPPITLLSKVLVDTGELMSLNKTCARIRQKEGEAVTMKVSLAQSFDLEGSDLSMKHRVLYGPKGVIVKKGEADREYLITVPADAKLPRGRTDIIFVANDGESDSNPAVVSVYRPHGKENLKPVFTAIEELVVRPGRKLSRKIVCSDPEGYPVKLSIRSTNFAHMKGNRLKWDCPKDEKPGVKTLWIIAEDGCGSFNSLKVNIRVL